MSILAISDLHADFRENWQLINEIPRRRHQSDTLIVAGDIADRLEIIKDTLTLLRSRFQRVFYTPGNHELWIRNESYDSIGKLFTILTLCDHLDIQTKPARVGDVWIVPLFSWYDQEFDHDNTDGRELKGWPDFYLCKWPAHIGSVSEYFLAMNKQSLQTYDSPVISFSHFLPRRELLPARERLKFKGLPEVAGSELLQKQVMELKSTIHVFGHSHINRDSVIDGVRYIQNALSYPRERKTEELGLKRIWD